MRGTRRKKKAEDPEENSEDKRREKPKHLRRGRIGRRKKKDKQNDVGKDG